jgi:uroporphyrin-III C-methyltransferase
MKGKVHFVGAGPGDPELLTLRAARLLGSADVILYDELVTEAVLRLVSPQAQLYNVGKRCQDKKITQLEINELMIALANDGLDVVRLKSGDPFIFGRGGEEIAALQEAEIEFEVVPGITAALGAAASVQIPLTHRKASHALVFLTGSSANGSDHTNWRALVSLDATIAIYMPGYHYGQIARKLRDAGLCGETPCAIISRATTPEQQVHWTTVEQLSDTLHLPAPTLLLIGEVLRHAAKLIAPEELGSWICSVSTQLSSEI